MIGELHSVEIENGETIAYRTRDGGDVPLVLLHSNITSSVHWDLLFEHIDERLELYALDMRGFGESTYHSEIDELGELAEDVEYVAEELELERFALLGWSTGGSVAMEFAADNPGLVEKLVGLSPVPTREYVPVKEKDDNGDPIPNTSVQKRNDLAADTDVQTVLTAQYNDAYEPMKQMWRELAYSKNEPEPDRFESYAADMCTQRNYLDIEYSLAHFNISDVDTKFTTGDGKASNIDCPTRIFRGDRDPIITAELMETTVSDIGENAEYVVLDDCSHNPMIDDLDQTLGAIEEFILGG